MKEDFFVFLNHIKNNELQENLNDDQLEAMFTATDEEMWQIEQPLECFIERTKHKCKRCTRFFWNEATLKQHQCES